MAESVGVSFVNESDFHNEGKWYILISNSQFEVCLTVSSDINGSLAGKSEFSKDIVSEAGSDSGGISSHGGSKTTRTVIIIRNPRFQQFHHPSIDKSRVIATLYSRDSNYKT